MGYCLKYLGPLGVCYTLGKEKNVICLGLIFIFYCTNAFEDGNKIIDLKAIKKFNFCLSLDD